MGVKVKQKLLGMNGEGKPIYSREWWIFIDHKGSRKAVKVGSKDVATAKAKEVEAALTLGKLDLNPPEPHAPVLFGEYAEKWMAGHVAVNLKYATRMNYRGTLDRHIVPVYGKRPVAEISRSEIKDYCHEKLRQRLSTGSVTLLTTVLPSIFGCAREDGIVSANPTEKPGKYLKTPEGEGAIPHALGEQRLIGCRQETLPTPLSPHPRSTPHRSAAS